MHRGEPLGIAACKTSLGERVTRRRRTARAGTSPRNGSPQRVYDALDARNYKAALKLRDKNAKKNPC